MTISLKLSLALLAMVCTVRSATLYSSMTNLQIKPIRDIVIPSSTEMLGMLTNWGIEGKPISKALLHIFRRPDVLSKLARNYQDKVTLLYVISVGGNGGTPLDGLVKLLSTFRNSFPFTEIIVVYMLDYIKMEEAVGVNMHKVIAHLLTQLKALEKPGVLDIKVYRFQLQSDTNVKDDYQDKEKCEASDVTGEQTMIKDMNTAWASTVTELKEEVIDVARFSTLMETASIQFVCIGIVGSGVLPANKETQVRRAHTRVLLRLTSAALREREKDDKTRPFVLGSDGPSGMNEDGEWFVGKGYKVDFVIYAFWPKPQINCVIPDLNGTVYYVHDTRSRKGERFVETAFKQTPATILTSHFEMVKKFQKNDLIGFFGPVELEETA